jgi:integrase
MGTLYERGRTWWLKYKDATGAWKPEATRAATKTEARSLLHELERRVERQRLGLEPVSLNPEGWNVGDLLRWWLETYSRHSPSHEKNLGTVCRQILGTPLAEKPLQPVQPGDVEQVLQAMEGDYSASTINHVRQFLVGAFNRAREAGKWLGANPAEPVRTRRGTEQVGDILRPEELAPFVAALEPDQRPVFAAAIFTGLRKGELCALQKSDVDLQRRLLAARRSYARPFPKSRKQRVVRFPDELVPFLEHALATFPGPWLFPDPDGVMRTVTWQPEDILRRALKRAGIVTGYTHVCRRSTCRFSEERKDDEIRPCPRCGFKLWPKGNVRTIRFHAALVSVQRLLGHSDPKITERRYGHLLPDFMASEVNRLRFGLDRLAPRPSTGSGRADPLGTSLVHPADPEKREAGTTPDSGTIPASLLAGCRGLEPLASGVTGRRYNQLN